MKTLIAGQTVETPYGETWDEAILTVDDILINYLTQTLKMTVHIYVNATARTEEKRPFAEKFFVSKDEFLANFTPTDPITSLKDQCEDYALTLMSPFLQVLFGDLFE